MSRTEYPRERRLLKIGRYELLLHREEKDRPLGETLLVLRTHPKRRHLHLVRTDD